MASRVGAIVLAAGASVRLGYPKQTVLFKGETLVDRAVRMAREAGAAETVVVLGANADEIRRGCRLDECTVVENSDWATGMGSSIRCGVGALGDVEGVLILTCDMPVVSAEHLRALAGRGRLVASEYGGQRGVPAYFPREVFDALWGLEGSRGAGQLLVAAEAIALPGGEFDVDTPDDVARLRRLERELP
jgi:molybdenum cofactor cytidylyltransferase